MKYLLILFYAVLLTDISGNAYADENPELNLSLSAGRMSLEDFLSKPLESDVEPEQESRYVGLALQTYLSERLSILVGLGRANDFQWVEGVSCLPEYPCEPLFSLTPMHLRYASIGIGYDLLQTGNLAFRLSAERARYHVDRRPDREGNERSYPACQLGAALRWNVSEQWFVGAEWTAFRFEDQPSSTRLHRTGIVAGFSFF